MACVVTCVSAVLVIPWASQVRIPAVLEHHAITPVHATSPAQIEAVQVHPGSVVAAGDPLISLASSDIRQELALATLRSKLVELRQSRLTSDATDREAAIILQQQQASLRQRIDGLRSRIQELKIVATVPGRIVEMAPDLQAGRWVGVEKPLLLLSGNGDPVIRGLVDANDVWRLETGSRGRFIPNDFMRQSIAVELTGIATADASTIDQPELAGAYGGDVPSRLDAQQRPVAEQAQYPVRARFVDQTRDELPNTTLAGVIVVDGCRESLLGRTWRQLLKVLVRESGF